MSFWVYLSLASLLVYAWRTISRRRRSRLPYPPGPRGFPVIGNLLDMPASTAKPWLTFNEWTKVYGGTVSMNILGQHIIILGTSKSATDLFTKKSNLFSDRPRSPMAVELMGWNFNFGFLSYNEWWRRNRRVFHDFFYPAAVVNYRELQQREAQVLLYRLLKEPEEFLGHIRLAFAAMVMKVSYGVNVVDHHNPYVITAEAAVNSMTKAALPGAYYVDYLPILKYVPAWFPGAGFKKIAAAGLKLSQDMYNLPYEEVRKAVENGMAEPSVASNLISKLDSSKIGTKEYEEEEKVAKGISAVSYAAGSDTTVSVVQSFFLAMAMYPKVQKKAQAELDRVLGASRLPTFADRASLPYIEAILKETLRWQPVTPLAVPHLSAADVEYDGYFIPKGSVVMGNTWGILHNPEVYPEPEEYKPERFLKDGQLDDSVPDPDLAAFGFGRRTCPGRYFSDGSMYSIVSAVLSVYDITAPLDENGQPIQLTPDTTSGSIIYPLPFKCDIKPRTRAAERLIEEIHLGEN